MGALTIRDDALWAKHIHDPKIRDHVIRLQAGDRVRLIVDGQPIVFRKMRDGADGRPTPGLRADSDDLGGSAVWASLQSRRGETFPVSLSKDTGFDPYLTYLDGFLSEWNTPEDAAAFDGL